MREVSEETEDRREGDEGLKMAGRRRGPLWCSISL